MQTNAALKNIIFDFGGVLLNIDFSRTEKAFSKLGLKEFDVMYSQSNQAKLFDVFEKGEISAAEFRNRIRKHIKHEVTDLQIDSAWNSMLLNMPKERVDLISELKKKHKVFLLSNTNEIHFSAFTSCMRKEFARDVFADMFHKTYFSHLVNMRKPDAEIFELVLTENNLRKKETLFIDDSIQNIEGAKKIGLNAVLLEKGKTILDLFTL